MRSCSIVRMNICTEIDEIDEIDGYKPYCCLFRMMSLLLRSMSLCCDRYCWLYLRSMRPLLLIAFEIDEFNCRNEDVIGIYNKRVVFVLQKVSVSNNCICQAVVLSEFVWNGSTAWSLVLNVKRYVNISVILWSNWVYIDFWVDGVAVYYQISVVRNWFIIIFHCSDCQWMRRDVGIRIVKR